jgi:hypothetical protein
MFDEHARDSVIWIEHNCGYSGLRNRCPDAQHISRSRPRTAAAADPPLVPERQAQPFANELSSSPTK